MRTVLTVSAIALLVAACSDRQTTAPTATPSSPASIGNANTAVVPAAIKPASFTVFTATGLAETVFGHPGNQGATSIAMCPAGSVVTGGGYDITAGYRDLRITDSKPNAAGTGWVISGAWYGDDFNGTNYATFSAIATCIK